MPTLTLTLNGHEASVEQVARLALTNYGHFTSMQVRAGGVLGLDLHLSRLANAHRELFGYELDKDWLRQTLRSAVPVAADCSVRVTAFESEAGAPQVLVAVTEPVSAPRAATKLTTVPYVRSTPHLKHVGTFPQLALRKWAGERGFDDALLVTADGFAVETTIANVGFLAPGSVTWPSGPNLPGVTWQLLEAQLPSAGIASDARPLRVSALADFDGAFVANSTGLTPVASIDGWVYPVSSRALLAVQHVFDQMACTQV